MTGSRRASESLIISQPLDITWKAGNDPRKLSREVPMLRSFKVEGAMREGARVSEIHTILGVPQKFEGEILRYDEGRHWAMSTHPVSWGPASLPHSADYTFEPVAEGKGTRVEIGCDYELKGLLRLPGAGWLTSFLMRWTIKRLLRTIELRASNSCA